MRAIVYRSSILLLIVFWGVAGNIQNAYSVPTQTIVTAVVEAFYGDRGDPDIIKEGDLVEWTWIYDNESKLMHEYWTSDGSILEELNTSDFGDYYQLFSDAILLLSDNLMDYIYQWPERDLPPTYYSYVYQDYAGSLFLDHYSIEGYLTQMTLWHFGLSDITDMTVFIPTGSGGTNHNYIEFTDIAFHTQTSAAVPEPTTMLLLGTGLLGLTGFKRKLRKV